MVNVRAHSLDFGDDDHMWVWANEDTSAHRWERWATEVESILGYSLDGDQDTDGYSMDWAYDLWLQGLTSDDAADLMRV